VIRRELEPSMLNGDAHHSLSWEVELRILAVVGLSKRSPQRITEAAKTQKYEVLSAEF
jgi:hypothetical protein